MIIDCYPSSFAPWDTACGYESLAQKMRIIQRELGGHHQPTMRVRDRKLVDNTSLADPDTGELTGAEWTRHNGQIAWTYEGETYKKQYFPPMLNNLECPPELMMSEMDYAGVDAGILHTHPHKGYYRFQNEFQRNVLSRFPDRFMRTIMVNAHAIPRDPEGAAQEVQTEVNAGGRTAVQFIPRYYYHPALETDGGNDAPWDDGAMRPFWQAVAAMGVPVFFTIIGRGSSQADRYGQSAHEVYLEEQRILLRWMERYPDVTVVITHGLPWRSYLDGDRIVFPDEVWQVFEAPQCHLELMMPIQMGGIWEYPWKQAEPTIQECVQRIGANRLMWGSDWPMVGRFCTYRQNVDQYRAHCGFLSDAERQDILGGTAARIMGWAGS